MMDLPDYIDIHTHKQTTSGLSIINVFPGAEHLVEEGLFYSAGIHPWYINQQSVETEIDLLEKLIIKKNVLAVGEAGLDRFSKVNFDLQLEIFKRQINISEKYEKPLIIHCVKSYSEVISIRKNIKAKQSWIIHGFSANAKIAEQLISHSIKMSFGHLLITGNNMLKNLFKEIPDGTFFLETDEKAFSIMEIYSAAAVLRGIKGRDLTEQIKSNFLKIFRLNG